MARTGHRNIAMRGHEDDGDMDIGLGQLGVQLEIRSIPVGERRAQGSSVLKATSSAKLALADSN
jgi:hypothetical protein